MEDIIENKLGQARQRYRLQPTEENARECERLYLELQKLKSEGRVNHLQQAIRRVLADDESRPGGWGPDVTMLEFLQQALRESEEPFE